MMYHQKQPTAGDTTVTLYTNHGDIVLLMFPEVAPKAVENFTTHAKEGYYDGLIFHRVIADFMIQGGDPTGTGRGGESIWGKPFEDEFSLEAFNIRGAISMANAGPGTNGSQFFIVQAGVPDARMLSQLKSAGFPDEAIEAYSTIGGTPWLDHRHTVFGRVVSGMDVVDEIAAVPVGAGDKPKEDVIIERATVAVEE